MSKSRDIAIELFGQETGQGMEPADVYHRLANGVVKNLVRIDVSDAGERELLPSFLTDALDNGELAERVENVALSMIAYHVGYRAQMDDGLSGEVTNLDKLAGLYVTGLDDSQQKS